MSALDYSIMSNSGLRFEVSGSGSVLIPLMVSPLRVSVFEDFMTSYAHFMSTGSVPSAQIPLMVYILSGFQVLKTS